MPHNLHMLHICSLITYKYFKIIWILKNISLSKYSWFTRLFSFQGYNKGLSYTYKNLEKI